MEQLLNKLTVFRSERKYLIGLEDRMQLIKALHTILVPDAYGGYNGYRVRSVYFDGRDNQDYNERRQKFEFVKRVRLRVYDINDQMVKFEIKKKKSGNQIKDTLLIHRADAQEMINGNYEVLKKYEGETAELGYEVCTTMGYRPISMVEYKRRAFTHPSFSTRITLDSELRYCNFDYDLFAERPNYHYAMGLTDTILEVKYDRFLFPQLQDVLTRCNLNKCHISKFGSSRQLLEEFYY